MSEAGGGSYDQFATLAGEYGVELTRVEPTEATDAIDDLIEEPAVGAPLPWDGVDLPERVQTDPTPAEIDESVTGVTGAALGVASYGSILLQYTPAGDEPTSLFPDLHVAVLREEDIVPDMEAAFEWIGEEFRETRGSGILATGPSATADMGALVKGAHGPKDVHIVVIT